MNKSDEFFLIHIRDEIHLLDSLIPGLTPEKLLADPILKHCIQKAIEIIGEASKNLSEEIQTECKEINWGKYRKLRNRLTHEYFSIDWDLVWDILQNDIPKLRECVASLLKE